VNVVLFRPVEGLFRVDVGLLGEYRILTSEHRALLSILGSFEYMQGSFERV